MARFDCHVTGLVGAGAEAGVGAGAGIGAGVGAGAGAGAGPAGCGLLHFGSGREGRLLSVTVSSDFF